MSSFQCEHCGAVHLDSPTGYVTGCEHYPVDAIALGCATHRRGVSSNGKTGNADESLNGALDTSYAAAQAIREIVRG